MDEIRDLIQTAQDAKQVKDVLEAVNYLAKKNIEEVFTVLKDIFFHPLTQHEVRMGVGKLMASTRSPQIYNLLLSHLILRNFSDLASIIYTLGEYKNPEIYQVLIREYPTCNFETQIEIIIALGKIKSVEAIEFFSKVFNEEIRSANLTQEQTQKLKQTAGDALQNQVMDF